MYRRDFFHIIFDSIEDDPGRFLPQADVSVAKTFRPRRILKQRMPLNSSVRLLHVKDVGDV